MKRLLPILTASGFVFILATRGLAAEPTPAQIKVHKTHVDFLVGDQLITRYHTDPEVAKPYFWPVHGPSGIPLTRAWPMEKDKEGESMDHPHQKSLWFCHGDVIPDGVELKEKIKGVDGVDFWSERPGYGKMTCTSVGEPKQKGNHAQIVTQNEWSIPGGARIMDETRTLHLYQLGDANLLVVEIDLEATSGSITFGDTKEGSFGVRVNDVIAEAKKNGHMENAEGKISEKECWGQQSAWVDYSGTIDGKKVGIAVFDDPANAYKACWHSRGYGLMAANPFGRAKSGFPAMKDNTSLVKLAKGEHLKLRYGVLLHAGDAKEGKVGEYFQKFVKLKG